MRYELKIILSAEGHSTCSCCLNINISLELNQQSSALTRSPTAQLSAVRCPFHLHGTFKAASPQG